MKTGLYFGTFNPIHIGHMAIANYMVEFTDIEQLWFVVSPQNPFKEQKHLLKDDHRLELVNRAIDGDGRFRASAIEFKLSRPSYTVNTLACLRDAYPDHEFYLIMGSDNLKHFNNWKDADLILQNHHVLVYPRPGHPVEDQPMHPHIHPVHAPLMEISASFIRRAIEEGKNVSCFIPSKAYQYLREMNFYRKA
ncbi:MAG: nicotinate (nicotinamide) nucleotide adenylyltransferase [Mangrovibacterium sp.]|nr:nicotinate (nicotinamide) nucleotide adenylyltransferase [Mangrovibacterium sp.]